VSLSLSLPLWLPLLVLFHYWSLSSLRSLWRCHVGIGVSGAGPTSYTANACDDSGFRPPGVCVKLRRE